MLTRVPKLPIVPLTDPLHCRVTLAYLTHLFMEVFFQARNALERVDIETYTAARGRGGDMVRITCDYRLHPPDTEP